MGIMSMLVGLLALIVNLGSGAFFFMAAAWSRPPAPPPLPAPLPPASVSPFLGQTLRPEGLPAERRQALLSIWALDGPFAEDRRLMLDRLLAEIGQRIGSADGWQKQPSNSSDDVWSPDVFVGPIGRIELGNNSAALHPSVAGTGVQGGNSVNVQETLVTVGTVTRWSAAAMDQRILELRRQLPPITDLQAGAVVQLLDQTINASTLASPQRALGRGQRQQVSLHGFRLFDGVVLSGYINDTEWLILPDGRSVRGSLVLHGIDPARGAPRPPPRAPFVPFVPASPAAMTALGIHAGAGVILASLLMFAGMRTISNSPMAATWHLRYVGIKVILVVVEVSLCIWFLTSIYDPPAPRTMVVRVAPRLDMLQLIGVLLGSIYPCTVLGLMLCAESIQRFSGLCGSELPAWRPRMRDKLSSRPVRMVASVAAALAGLVACGHLGIGASSGWAHDAEVSGAVLHVIVGGLMLLAALIVLRLSRSARQREAMR